MDVSGNKEKKTDKALHARLTDNSQLAEFPFETTQTNQAETKSRRILCDLKLISGQHSFWVVMPFQFQTDSSITQEPLWMSQELK